MLGKPDKPKDLRKALDIKISLGEDGKPVLTDERKKKRLVLLCSRIKKICKRKSLNEK